MYKGSLRILTLTLTRLAMYDGGFDVNILHVSMQTRTLSVAAGLVARGPMPPTLSTLFIFVSKYYSILETKIPIACTPGFFHDLP